MIIQYSTLTVGLLQTSLLKYAEPQILSSGVVGIYVKCMIASRYVPFQYMPPLFHPELPCQCETDQFPFAVSAHHSMLR